MDLKLNVLLALVEKTTGPLKSITGQATRSAKALRDTRQRLRDLENTKGAVNAFRSFSKANRDLAKDLKEARDRSNAMGKALAGTSNVSAKQRREFAQLRAETKNAERAFVDNATKLQSVREKLKGAGIDTRKLAGHERELKASIAATNETMAAQEKRMAAINEQQKRMGAARAQLQRGQAAGANVAIGGAAAMATGHAILEGVRPQLDEAKAFQQQVAQLRAQGIGDEAVADAVKYARSMDVIGSSATDNLKLVKEAYSVLRDMHESEEIAPYLAKMKFGIESVMAQGGHGEGHGANAEAMFMDLLKVAELRGAAKNPETLKRVLDYSTQAYVASGGLVKPEDLLNMIKTGGVAAKQLDDTSFFFGLLHTMQEMGGHRAGTGLATGYQNWAAGRTTQQAAEELESLGLLNKSSVKYGKTGHVTKLLPDALKDGELYRSNPFEFLMTRVVPKLNPGGALNDQQVVSKINALFSGRKGGDLFASLYLERANIAKHLAAAPKAYGVDALYREGGATAGGMEIDLEAKKRDLYRELGTQLLPVYVAGLTKVVAVVKRLTAWAEQHPKLARALTIGAAGIGVLMTAAGALMITLGALIGQFALLRFAAKATGIRLGAARLFGGGAAAASGAASASTGAAGAAGQAGLFGRIAMGARAAAVAVLGVSAPVLAIVAVLVVAALVVRKYWGPISAWFEGVGQGIREGFGPALASITTALAPLKPAWDAISGAIGAVVRWAMQLIEPFQATSEQLAGARENGASFGRVVGAVLGGIVQALTFGIRMFVGLGQAIGNAAGWAVTSWGPVSDYFTSLWVGVKMGASQALEWIEKKVDAVRGVIQHLYAMWQKITGQTGSAEPMEWIMPNDSERARKIADAIARNPIDASPGANASIVSPTRIGTPAVGNTYHVQVDARGMDPKAAQQMIGDALRDHDRKKATTARSSYSDED